jgi:hypothetical protein
MAKRKTVQPPGQNAIPSTVGDEDAAFDFQAKERASDDGHENAKDEAAARNTAMADLLLLEEVMDQDDKGHRKAVEAMREIRERKLFRLRDYDTFDDYVECHRGRTRQWATQEINWLRACECLESHGKAPYQFSKHAIQPAAYLLECDPEGFCEVYLGAAAKALPVTENAIKESLKDYLRRIQLRGEWDRWQENAKVPEAERVPVTKEEAALLDFPWERRSYATNLVEKAKDKAKETGRTWQECLPEVCQEERKTPMPEHLLAAARGDDLKEVVLPLRAELQRWEDHDRAEKEAKELIKRAREIRDAYRIKPKPTRKNRKARVPEPGEVVQAMERSFKTALGGAYLRRAGVECWKAAWALLDPTDRKDKEATQEAVEQMAALLEQFRDVDWA